MTHRTLCIVGAHRSGTSMLTRLLHACGLELGPESDLMPAAADNPDGFWENLRFVALNDEILAGVGAAWDLPPWQDEPFQSERLEPARAKAQILVERFASAAVWGWKDPRNCITLPFWQQLLPGLRTVVIVRNPLEAAYSMHKRNGTSYALGLRLWEIYNRRVLAHTRVEERIITSYQTFFEDPQRELAKIVRFAGLNTPAIAAAADLVAVDRRHTSFTVEQMIDAGVSSEIIRLYQTLLRGADEAVEIPSDSIGAGRDPLTGTESRLNAQIANAEDTRRELARRRGAEKQHREEIVRHEQTIEGLRQELAAKSVRAAAEINRRDGRIEELQKAYAHLDRLLQEQLNERNRLLAELANTRRNLESAREEGRRDAEELRIVQERFAQTNQLLREISVRASTFETRSNTLAEQLRKRLFEIKKLLRWLDQIEDAALRLRQSRRWKFSNPFATLAAFFRGRSTPGFGHLDKNVERYRSWRLAHPDLDSLAEEIQALRPREILPSPDPPAPDKTAATARAKPPPPSKPIAFPRLDKVEVSIIIPVYNQVEYTLACLAAVQEHSAAVPCEVIVVDDCSTDSTEKCISALPGVTYLKNASNQGFIFSCNRGAAAARGKYLAFLNNDAMVRRDWLESLLQTFEFEPQAGLVGSKLVYPDGRLQEAGGIIWRDGSGWNRGKFQDAAKPEYNHLREVHYCSAASLMIPKALFDRVGGFDSKYAPAYYEDTDLAFKVAQAGRKILYQPLSVVIHYEGVTSGTDLSVGAKRYQEVNRTTFVNTWASVLASLPENGDLESYYALPPGKKHILVIDHHLPMPDRDSGSLRMFNLLRVLHGLGHEVTFLPDNLADIPPYGDQLRKHGIIVLHHPYARSIRDYLQTEGRGFNIIILSRCDFARKHVADVREFAPKSHLIFDTVDLHFLREKRAAAITGQRDNRERAREKRQIEFDLIQETDQTWVVSPVEREVILSSHPHSSVEVVSNIVELPGSVTPFAERRDILFIGSFQHPPNTDGVLFFSREILPLVQERIPDLRFYIIGDKAPPEVVALSSERVILTGYQPDVSIYFNTVTLSVAPLRYGAGVKGKINQSLAFGVPVVATSVAAEGMDILNREEGLIADTPETFAAAVIELYRSESLWNRISKRGLRKTQKFYSMEAARQQFLRIFSTLSKKEVDASDGCVDSSILVPAVGKAALSHRLGKDA
jgi:GT2 family glycosyltransferase/glycosyltransferase involved in cell wall biosynthesis